MSTEGRLAALDTNVSNLNQKITDQSEQLVILDGKIDQLLLREATRDGEFKGMRMSAIAIATAISSIIALASWAAPYFVG